MAILMYTEGNSKLKTRSSLDPSSKCILYKEGKLYRHTFQILIHASLQH